MKEEKSREQPQVVTIVIVIVQISIIYIHMSIEITLCTVMPKFNRSYFEEVIVITVREL